MPECPLHIFTIHAALIRISNSETDYKEIKKTKKEKRKAENQVILTYRDANISIGDLILPEFPLQMSCNPYRPKRPLLGQNKLRIKHLLSKPPKP